MRNLDIGQRSQRPFYPGPQSKDEAVYFFLERRNTNRLVQACCFMTHKAIEL